MYYVEVYCTYGQGKLHSSALDYKKTIACICICIAIHLVITEQCYPLIWLTRPLEAPPIFRYM